MNMLSNSLEITLPQTVSNLECTMFHIQNIRSCAYTWDEKNKKVLLIKINQINPNEFVKQIKHK